MNEEYDYERINYIVVFILLITIIFILIFWEEQLINIIDKITWENIKKMIIETFINNR